MADDPRVAALVASAQRLGANPVDLATVISYETGGTFNPGIRGGAGNRHVGLIQFGPNEQQAYGASQGQSFEDQLPAVEGYLTDRGFKPGMGRLDLYSTINAGRPGRYTASDAGNGGAPGTVADKVAGQMGAHEAKAAAFLGGTFSPGSASPMGAFGLSGPVVAGTAGSTSPAGGAAMQAPQQAESGPSVAALLRALGSDGPTAAQVAPAQSAGPAPLALQPMQHRAQPFDAPDTSPRSRAPPAPEPPDNLTRPNPAPRGARAMPLAWGAHDRPHRLQRRPDLERSRRAPNQLPGGPARRDCEQLGARADGGPRLLAGRQPRLAPGHARRRRCLRADD